MDAGSRQADWVGDIDGLNLAWLMLIRAALRADGPLAIEHFRLRDAALAEQLSSMSAAQLVTLAAGLKHTPVVALEESAAFKLLVQRTLRGSGEAADGLQQLARAAVDRNR